MKSYCYSITVSKVGLTHVNYSVKNPFTRHCKHTGKSTMMFATRISDWDYINTDDKCEMYGKFVSSHLFLYCSIP